MTAETLPGAEYPKRKTRRGYSTLLAKDPHDPSGEWDVLLPDAKLAWVASRGIGSVKELADTVRWTLRNARHIRRGVRDDHHDLDEDSWLCYVGRPTHAYDRHTGNQRPPWDDGVFLVYVTDERVVYLWYWDHCDPDHAMLPRDYRTRFGHEVI